MKKILLGFIAIGLITFVACEKGDDTAITDDSSIQYGEGATDIDGNTYQSVIIGTQEWMVENLRTTKYNDGTIIPNVAGNTEWGNLSTGAWTENDSQYEATYGKLYDFYAVETGKLAPLGWHVPTDTEWTVLTDYLTANGHNGTALKSTSGWNDRWDGTSGNGTDDYGWLGLPGGNRNADGYFDDIGYFGFWWSSSQYNTSVAWYSFLGYFFDGVYRNGIDKENGFSVRCLRD